MRTERWEIDSSHSTGPLRALRGSSIGTEVATHAPSSKAVLERTTAGPSCGLQANVIVFSTAPRARSSAPSARCTSSLPTISGGVSRSTLL